MIDKPNEEYHVMIEDLNKQKFFGEVTFYFQNGNIESCRKSERITKSEMIAQVEAKKREERKPVVVTRKAGA